MELLKSKQQKSDCSASVESFTNHFERKYEIIQHSLANISEDYARKIELDTKFNEIEQPFQKCCLIFQSIIQETIKCQQLNEGALVELEQKKTESHSQVEKVQSLEEKLTDQIEEYEGQIREFQAKMDHLQKYLDANKEKLRLLRLSKKSRINGIQKTMLTPTRYQLRGRKKQFNFSSKFL